jgi:hypothetical protein
MLTITNSQIEREGSERIKDLPQLPELGNPQVIAVTIEPFTASELLRWPKKTSTPGSFFFWYPTAYISCQYFHVRHSNRSFFQINKPSGTSSNTFSDRLVQMYL